VGDLEALDPLNLGEWMVKQRWFASKAREVAGVHVLEAARLGGDPPLAIAVVEVRFHPGTHELYQVPLVLREDGGIHDAVEDPDAMRRLVEAIGRGEDIAREDATWCFEATGPLPQTLDPVRAIGVEQSNSSIVFGDELILKVYRRIEPGPNPEVELLRFLTEHGFEHIARLRGWYEHNGALLDATLGLLQEFLPGARDGWALALDGLREDGGEAFLTELEALGTVTGQLHAALASDASDPTFAPEEPSVESLGLLIATVDEEIEQLFLDLPDTEAVRPIVWRGEEVRDKLSSLARIGTAGRAIRTHGDYHLGQTLRTERGWVVLDFEGEPARSLPERRRKRSPLRDVAGMLRSLSYAAAGSRLLHGVPAPDGWEARARARFLDGYRGAVDPALLPHGSGATEQLLAVYELEKAVYELRYELNNRPEWVGIPVAGIARLLDDEESA